MKDKYSRRALLKALGVGAGMLPLLNNEWASAADAGAPAGNVAGMSAPGNFPKRFICVVWTNGVYQKNWWQTSSGTDLTAGTLLPILAPLAPFKSKLLIPHNIAIQNVYDFNNYGGHFGYPCILTGTQKGTGPSIDTMIAQASPGVANAQLNLGCRPSRPGMSWKAGGVANTPNTSPTSVFNQLFAGANLSPTQIVTTQAKNKSILDLVSTQLTAFQGRVGTDDKVKIQSHLDAIRGIENSLSSQTLTMGCAPPSLTGATMSFTQIANYPTHVDLMMKLAATSVTCGITRAVTIELIDDGGGNSLTFPWLNINSPNYHDLAHTGSASAAQKTQIDAWWYTQVATLLGILDGSSEGTGTTLDNSCVLVANDMQEGNTHFDKNVPWLMAGSCGGFFKTGRVVETNNAANNQLLTTICHAMGLSTVATVGDKYTGNLDSILT
jgi:hypothetical protein